jgi:hypothetical protein
MNIATAVGDGSLNEIDIGGVVLHKEYFFHCGSPSFSRRVLNTAKGVCKEGVKRPARISLGSPPATATGSGKENSASALRWGER